MAWMESELKMPVSNWPTRKMAKRVGLLGYVVRDHLVELWRVSPVVFDRSHMAAHVGDIFHLLPSPGAHVLVQRGLPANGIEMLLAVHGEAGMGAWLNQVS